MSDGGYDVSCRVEKTSEYSSRGYGGKGGGVGYFGFFFCVLFCYVLLL